MNKICNGGGVRSARVSGVFSQRRPSLTECDLWTRKWKISEVNCFYIGLRNPYYTEKNSTHSTLWLYRLGVLFFLSSSLDEVVIFSAVLKVLEDIYWVPYMKCGRSGGEGQMMRAGNVEGGWKRGSRLGYQGGLVIKKATREASCSGGKLQIKAGQLPAPPVSVAQRQARRCLKEQTGVQPGFHPPRRPQVGTASHRASLTERVLTRTQVLKQPKATRWPVPVPLME